MEKGAQCEEYLTAYQSRSGREPRRRDGSTALGYALILRRCVAFGT